MKKKTVIKKSKLEIGLLKSLKEAVKFEEGKMDLRATTIEIPDAPPAFSKKEVKEIRARLKVSQPIFAKILGVSDDTVKAWERGSNSPSGSSARLIQLAKKDPQHFLKEIQSLS